MLMKYLNPLIYADEMSKTLSFMLLKCLQPSHPPPPIVASSLRPAQKEREACSTPHSSTAVSGSRLTVASSTVL